MVIASLLDFQRRTGMFLLSGDVQPLKGRLRQHLHRAQLTFFSNGALQQLHHFRPALRAQHQPRAGG